MEKSKEIRRSNYGKQQVAKLIAAAKEYAESQTLSLPGQQNGEALLASFMAGATWEARTFLESVQAGVNGDEEDQPNFEGEE